jgi:hypothetical protein
MERRGGKASARSERRSLNMKPYSKDLRLRVLAAVDRGEPREKVA